MFRSSIMKFATFVLFASFCAGWVGGADRRVVTPKGAEPNAGWSHGLLVDGTLYISGMGGEDASGKLPATFEAETQQALNNISAVLKEAGMSPADVVSVQ